MIVIALVLALVEKPTTTWTWLDMLLMLTNVTNNPMEKEIRQRVQDQKLVRIPAISCKGPTKLVMSRV